MSHFSEITAASVIDKLDRYLLNPDHEIGRPKARWFRRALGFTRVNAMVLARQIQFDPAAAIPTGTTEFGQKFEQTIVIDGVNGRKIGVRFVWMRQNDGGVRLVTAIPPRRPRPRNA